jgi:hypothetical protein
MGMAESRFFIRKSFQAPRPKALTSMNLKRVLAAIHQNHQVQVLAVDVMSVAIQLKLENGLVATTEVAKPGLKSLKDQNKARTMGFLSVTHSKFQS